MTDEPYVYEVGGRCPVCGEDVAMSPGTYAKAYSGAELLDSGEQRKTCDGCSARLVRTIENAGATVETLEVRVGTTVAWTTEDSVSHTVCWRGRREA